ncbi:MAG: hypothetical protein LBQ65_04795 [Tannerellaceae bacterium]|nr:hypothetical protein [Tannerellaceae bacterium]
MKKIVFTVMAVTTLLYACTREEVRIDREETKQANLKIQFSNLAANTKAFDGDGDAQAANLKNAMVFILGASNDILSRHYFSNSDIKNPKNKLLPTTTSASHVWVLCNLGDSSTYGTKFSACHTLTQLQNMTGKVEDVNNGFGNNPLGIWMVGSHDKALDFKTVTGSSTPEAQVEVNLDLIPSRIDVIVKNDMSNYLQNPDAGKQGHVDFPASLQLKDVSLINSASENYLFPRISASDTSYFLPYQTSGYYASGLDPKVAAYNLSDTNMRGIPILKDSSNLYAEWVPYTSNNTFQKTFYALPTDTLNSNNQDLILLVRSERSIHKLASAATPNAPLDSIEPRYFHVAFSPNDVVGGRLANGQYYTIEVRLTGNALTTGGGSTNPNVPIVNAFVEVTIKSGAWDKINTIHKTY